MNKCLFCQFAKDKENIIYENKSFYARFDAYPCNPGHALVIPKKHIVSFLDMPKEMLLDYFDAIKSTITIIEKTNLKKSYEKIIKANISPKSVAFCQDAIKILKIREKSKPDGYNIGNNDGRAAGRTIDHLHIQIIPRYFGDVENPTGGIRIVIPEKGDYKN